MMGANDYIDGLSTAYSQKSSQGRGREEQVETDGDIWKPNRYEPLHWRGQEMSQQKRDEAGVHSSR